MTRGKRKTQDQHFRNGSIVLWSERFTQDGQYYVPVICGSCGAKRVVATSGINYDFEGLCRECTTTQRRKLVYTGAQRLPNGSIIYWDDEQVDPRYPTRRRVVTVRCGGKYCNGSVRQVPVYIAAQPEFTGLCRRCAHFGEASSVWKGGRKRNVQGYVLIKLEPDHPFYCMSDANGYVLEHRLVMGKQLGRPLRKDEIVHHINGKKDDNRPENLELLVEHHHVGYQTASLAPNEPGLLGWLKRIVRR